MPTLEKTVESLAKRMAFLEKMVKSQRSTCSQGRFKCATAITAGDVYVVVNASNRIVDTTEDEGSLEPIVVALTGTTGEYESADFALRAGQAWVNFEEGTTPSILDYVITSTTAGKAKSSSTAVAGYFGQIIEWDATNLRGLVFFSKARGMIVADAYVRSTEPDRVFQTYPGTEDRLQLSIEAEIYIKIVNPPTGWLALYSYMGATPTGPTYASMYKVTEDWSETTITWNTRPAHDPTPLDTFYEDGYIEGWHHFPITPECTNINIKITSGALMNIGYYSREYADSLYRPCLAYHESGQDWS